MCCRIDGNVIESNSKISDNLQSRRGLEQFQIDGIGQKGKRSVLVAEMCDQLLFRQNAVFGVELDFKFPAQPIDGPVKDGARYVDLHYFSVI